MVVDADKLERVAVQQPMLNLKFGYARFFDTFSLTTQSTFDWYRTIFCTALWTKISTIGRESFGSIITVTETWEINQSNMVHPATSYHMHSDGMCVRLCSGNPIFTTLLSSVFYKHTHIDDRKPLKMGARHTRAIGGDVWSSSRFNRWQSSTITLYVPGKVQGAAFMTAKLLYKLL
jgi:hypothetical protein